LTITRRVGRELQAHVTSEESALHETLNAEMHNITPEASVSTEAASAGDEAASRELSATIIRMPVISDKKALDDIIK
jgi:hypothetical protein